MTDLLQRLRDYPHEICDEAADEIERLRAERDALRELLCECRIALMWPGGPAQAFLARIDAATAAQTTGTEPGAEGA